MNPQSQKAQAPFSHNGRRHSEGALDQQRGNEIRQHVEKDNARWAAAERMGGMNELLLSKRQDLASDQAGITGPSD